MFGFGKRRLPELPVVQVEDKTEMFAASLEMALVKLELTKVRHSLVQEIGKTVVSRLNVVLALNGVGLASTVALTKEIRTANPQYLGIPTASAVFFFVVSSLIAVRANASYKSYLPDISKDEFDRFKAAGMRQKKRAKELATLYHAQQLHRNEEQIFAPIERRLKWLNAASIVWLLGALCLAQLAAEWLTQSEPWYLHLL